MEMTLQPYAPQQEHTRTLWLCLPGTYTLLPIHTLISKMSPSNMIQLSIVLWWVKYGHKFFATLPL